MTEAERKLLIWLAKCFRDGTPADPAHIQRLIIAAQAPDNEIYNRTYPAEPTPICNAVELACRIYSGRSDGWSLEFIAQMRRVITAVVPIICAAKDRDTATVIADDDAKMEAIAGKERELRHRQNIIDDRNEEIERLKHSLELYRADIAVIREQRRTLRKEIERLSRHPDIDAAADRAREAWIAEQSPQMNWVGAWRAIARAVYGLDNKHPSTTNQRTSINEQD